MMQRKEVHTLPVTPPATSSPGSSPVLEAVLNLDIRDATERCVPLEVMQDAEFISIDDNFSGEIARIMRLPDLRLDPDASDAASTCEHLTSVAQSYLTWLQHAITVIQSLHSDDDIGWLAQNQQPIVKLDTSFKGFQQLLDNYYNALSHIDSHEMQKSQALSSLSSRRREMDDAWKSLTSTFTNINANLVVVDDWRDCCDSLDAMIGEVKALNSSIYLIEERRHMGVPETAIEVDVLATILDDAPDGENTGTPGKRTATDHFSMWNREATESLLRLTGKIAPLGASISIFEPRLEAFATRAEAEFPTAVKDVTSRYNALTSSFDALLKDFDGLKRELADDKWMVVFRQVKRQASDMMDSLSRTLKSLSAVPFTSPEANRLADNFVMKFEHYGKAIPQVLAIMHKGIVERLTLNGEIIRGSDVLHSRWAVLQIELAQMQRRIESGRIGGLLKMPSTDLRQKHTEASSIRSNCSKRAEISLVHKLRTRTCKTVSSELKTPRKSLGSSSRSVCETRAGISPSLLGFRKDVSLDPPRSRSRLSNVGLLTPEKLNSRPAWNSGTVARVLDSNVSSEVTSPLRTPSRAGMYTPRRSGAHSSLGLSRAQTPLLAPDTRRRVSNIPLKSPGRAPKASSDIPPVPTLSDKFGYAESAIPTKTTGYLAVPSRLPPKDPFSTSPAKAPAQRPKTPTSIPVSRRVVSTPDHHTLRSVSEAQSGSTTRHSALSGLKARRESSIPLPSPRKLLPSNH